MKNNIKCIRSGKSGGPDGILIEMLKTTILLICPILTNLLNKVMDSGEFPEAWGEVYYALFLRKEMLTIKTTIGYFSY